VTRGCRASQRWMAGVLWLETLSRMTWMSSETVPPLAHRRGATAQLSGDLDVRTTFGRREHDPAPQRQRLRRLRAPSPPLEHLALIVAQDHRSGRSPTSCHPSPHRRRQEPQHPPPTQNSPELATQDTRPRPRTRPAREGDEPATPLHRAHGRRCGFHARLCSWHLRRLEVRRRTGRPTPPASAQVVLRRQRSGDRPRCSSAVGK
jgi:hypothetical protein